MTRKKRHSAQKRFVKATITRFSCPNCSGRMRVTKIDKEKGFAIIRCENCGLQEKFLTTQLSEPVDVYGDLIDAYYGEDTYSLEDFVDKTMIYTKEFVVDIMDLLDLFDPPTRELYKAFYNMDTTTTAFTLITNEVLEFLLNLRHPTIRTQGLVIQVLVSDIDQYIPVIESGNVYLAARKKDTKFDYFITKDTDIDSVFVVKVVPRSVGLKPGELVDEGEFKVQSFIVDEVAIGISPTDTPAEKIKKLKTVLKDFLLSIMKKEQGVISDIDIAEFGDKFQLKTVY